MRGVLTFYNLSARRKNSKVHRGIYKIPLLDACTQPDESIKRLLIFYFPNIYFQIILLYTISVRNDLFFALLDLNVGCMVRYLVGYFSRTLHTP